MAGSLYKSVCFSDIALAKAAQCSDQGISAINPADGTVFVSRCEGADSTNDIMYSLVFKNGALANSMKIPYPTFPDCVYDGGASMAVDYFGAVLSALVVIALAARLKQIFWKNHEGV